MRSSLQICFSLGMSILPAGSMQGHRQVARRTWVSVQGGKLQCGMHLAATHGMIQPSVQDSMHKFQMPAPWLERRPIPVLRQLRAAHSIAPHPLTHTLKGAQLLSLPFLLVVQQLECSVVPIQSCAPTEQLDVDGSSQLVQLMVALGETHTTNTCQGQRVVQCSATARA